MDVSRRLGNYMLQGWILTDDICETPDCNVPLMRSSAGRSAEIFCANCDGGPVGSSDRKERPVVPTVNNALTSSSRAVSLRSRSASQYSRSSTPPTDVSDPLVEIILPPVTEEMLQRRAQSDQASSEIGKRLLQGWAMLADECTNPSCFGIPLVRAPSRPGGGVSAKKECVVCGNAYIDGPNNTLMRVDEHSSALPQLQSREKSLPEQSPTHNSAERVDPTITEHITKVAGTSNNSHPLSGPTRNAVSNTTAALELALDALSKDLTLVSSSPNHLNIGRISELSKTIGDVLTALEMARRIPQAMEPY